MNLEKHCNSWRSFKWEWTFHRRLCFVLLHHYMVVYRFQMNFSIKQHFLLKYKHNLKQPTLYQTFHDRNVFFSPMVFAALVAQMRTWLEPREWVHWLSHFRNWPNIMPCVQRPPEHPCLSMLTEYSYLSFGGGPWNRFVSICTSGCASEAIPQKWLIGISSYYTSGSCMVLKWCPSFEMLVLSTVTD